MADPEGDELRTSLAGERTLLAWWRTGFTAIAVALAVGRVLPDLARNSPRWPYVLIGVGFSLYGIALIFYGTRRTAKLAGGAAAASPSLRAMQILAAIGAALGIASIALILAQ